MTPQAKGFEYRKRCVKLALEVQELFLEQTGCKPLLSFNCESRYVKYMDPSGMVPSICVDGKTWNDLYINLHTAKEVVEFAMALKERNGNDGAGD